MSNQKIIKDVAIYSLVDFIFKGIAFLIFPIYTHIFSIADFGIMNLITTILGIFGIVMNGGVNNAVQRFYHDPETNTLDKKLIVSNGLFIIFIWSIIIFLFSTIILFLFSNYLLVKYNLGFLLLFVALLSNIPNQIINYSIDTIRLYFEPWKFVMLSALQNILGVIFGLLFIYFFHKGVIGFFFGLLVSTFFTLPFAIWFIKRDIVFAFDKKWTVKIIKYGFPFIYAGLGYWIFESIDRWLLASYKGNVDVGLFSIASKISSILLFLNQAFARAWSPQSIKLMKDYPNDYKLKMSTLFINWFALLVFLGSGLSLFAKEFLIIMTPISYWDSYLPCVFLCFSMVLLGTTQFTAIGISIKKRTNYFGKITWIVAIFNLILNLFIIPRYGVLGSTFVTMLSYLLLTSIYFFVSQKLHELPIQTNKLITLIITIVLTIILCFLIESFVTNIFYKIVYKIIWILSIFIIFSATDIFKISYIFNFKKNENINNRI